MKWHVLFLHAIFFYKKGEIMKKFILAIFSLLMPVIVLGNVSVTGEQVIKIQPNKPYTLVFDCRKILKVFSGDSFKLKPDVTENTVTVIGDKDGSRYALNVITENSVVAITLDCSKEHKHTCRIISLSDHKEEVKSGWVNGSLTDARKALDISLSENGVGSDKILDSTIQSDDIAEGPVSSLKGQGMGFFFDGKTFSDGRILDDGPDESSLDWDIPKEWEDAIYRPNKKNIFIQIKQEVEKINKTIAELKESNELLKGMIEKK